MTPTRRLAAILAADVAGYSRHVLQLPSNALDLRISPAMAAGISDRLWEMYDIVSLIDCARGSTEAARDLLYRRREVAELSMPGLYRERVYCSIFKRHGARA